jgi:uncharacterized protein
VADRIVRALVTGASSGLGEAFARQLGGRGVELVLVARDRDRLETLADELPVPVEVVPADLTDADQRARVESRLASSDAPVDLLVNNAGLGFYGAVVATPADQHETLVTLNVTALVRLTRAVLPQLIERGTGGVIQMGSVTAYQPNPYTATYGASKAFVRSFTEALQVELAGTGVHAMLLSPGTTRTAFHDRAGVDEVPLPDQAVMDADDVVAAALSDFARRRRVCIPGALNTALVLGAELAPSTVTGWLSGALHRRYRTSP